MRRSTGVSPNPKPADPDRLDPIGAAYRRADTEGSEYSWGAGLAPSGLENGGPAEGGRYHTRVPGRKIRD
ncbi:Uncharacterised protein [Mycobacteroides abscessus subsp. massiliense]|uniref:Uncharacterized protein n=1 Tax=Mycobacteroides abscessus subsp. massiliense TaxID=1962118 RepID=A0A1T8QT64_9MYCO|nr:hypothetical protein [Mycobacteroides abscessus]SIM38460.1 Uncharacterised protein [Mycobacteroides abscessus subsp. bolletii]SKE45425.1 Uncharacterised protein [Mycobacteroides abscessus subsp. massiliense]MBE5429649.1 hypothetical protein [Mycobacteroides abscessus]MBE5446861.1 hypothetical protein [Mycobacteroides abscessus]